MHEPARDAGDPPRVRRRIVRRPALAAAPEPVRPPSAAEPRLLRLAVDCARCGAPPALRVTPTIVAALANTPSSATVATYQCQRRGCGAVYPITAGAYQRAA